MLAINQMSSSWPFLITCLNFTTHKLSADWALVWTRGMRITMWSSTRQTSNNHCFVSINKHFILIIFQSIFQRIFLRIAPILFGFENSLDYLYKFIVLGPKVSFKLGKDQYSININLKGSKSWIMYKLFLILIKIFIFSDIGFSSQSSIRSWDWILLDNGIRKHFH